MSTITKDLGAVTAYAYAKEKGYTGTEAEFAELMASYATVAEQASQSAQTATEKAQQASASATSASQSADTASASAQTAQTAQQTATAKASEAQQSATTATTKAQEASQSASESSQSAQTAVQAKQDAQTAKTASETAQASAESARDDAESARDEAQQYAESIDPQKLIGAYPTDTATGAIASFSDGADNIPMKKVTVRIEPKQDLHGQDAPYPAGGGKNLFDGSTVSTSAPNNWGVSFADDALTITHKNESTSGVPQISLSFPAGTYVLSFASQIKTASISLYVDGAYNTVLRSGDTFTVADGHTYVITFSADVGTPNIITKIQIEKGDTPSAYAPYSNICPISGWTGCEVQRTGKNLLDLAEFARVYPDYCTYDSESGELAVTSTALLFLNGISVDIPTDIFDGGFLHYEAKNGTCTNFRFRIIYDDGTMTESQGTGTETGYVITTVPVYAKRIVSIHFNWSTYGTLTVKNAYITFGQTETAYEPYTGRTYPISFPSEAGTVYGGTLDVTNGVLTVDRAFIASYNGETLPSEWISDRDKYVAGTTPTTGAQVCYKLSQAVVYTLTPTEIKSILGNNNIWADTGDSTVIYRADTTLYINRKIAEAVSALS